MNNIKNGKLSIDKISMYADKVCKSNATNLEFLQNQFPNLDIKPENLFDINNPDVEWDNATSLGNIAYIALYSPEPYNEHAKNIYNYLMSIQLLNK